MFKYARYIFLFLRLLKTISDWVENNIEIREGDSEDEIRIKRNGI